MGTPRAPEATFSVVTLLDVSENGLYTDQRGFIDGFTDYHSYGFLVPGTNKKVVRFSLSSFDTEPRCSQARLVGLNSFLQVHRVGRHNPQP